MDKYTLEQMERLDKLKRQYEEQKNRLIEQLEREIIWKRHQEEQDIKRKTIEEIIDDSLDAIMSNIHDRIKEIDKNECNHLLIYKKLKREINGRISNIEDYENGSP